MKLSKGKLVAFAVILIAIGFVVGVLVQDIPLITFNTEIDVSTLIAVAGLVATIFIMPFMIDARTARLNSINSMVVVDLDSVCSYINKVRDLYGNMASSSSITIDQYTQIVSTFKQVAALLYALADEFDRCNMLQDFRGEIIANTYTPTYTTCTEKLQKGKKLSAKNIQESQVALDSLLNKIKQYRYRLYK